MGLGDMGWTTEAEIRYIDELALGLYSKTTHPAKLLKNYIESSKRRIKHGTFGGVDGHMVIHYAEEKLRELSKL